MNEEDMGQTGLLIVTSLSKLSVCLSAARRHVTKRLYINVHPTVASPQAPSLYSSAIARIYSSSVEHCGDLDVRVLVSNLRQAPHTHQERKIDVLLIDQTLPADVKPDLVSEIASSKVINIGGPASSHSDHLWPSSSTAGTEMYANVVLGGTFDRLHIAHKILLSEAVVRASERLVVGVTDINMVKSKTLSELILPVTQRIADVHNFLCDIDDTLQYEIVPIQDAFGPTKSDPNLDLIVVSAETFRGGEKVNEVRTAAGLRPLKVHSIAMLESGKESIIKEAKISSGNARIDLLGTLWQRLEPRPNLPARPYLIGLMGGIAAGKSVMCERLSKLGAKVIDCDKLAHKLYEPGEECFDRICEHFGPEIVASDGRVDRRMLGAIVFGDKAKLEELNAIVWPALLKAVKAKVAELYAEEKCEIFVLEAAILVKAGWQKECHEIWSLIIPREEAVKRLEKRNMLTREEACQRIDAQLDNASMVEHANVVFCTLWDYSYSQLQAERAWNLLMKRIADTK